MVDEDEPIVTIEAVRIALRGLYFGGKANEMEGRRLTRGYRENLRAGYMVDPTGNLRERNAVRS